MDAPMINPTNDSSIWKERANHGVMGVRHHSYASNPKKPTAQSRGKVLFILDQKSISKIWIRNSIYDYFSMG